LLQALIELAEVRSDERSILENISNHLAARGAAPALKQTKQFEEQEENGTPEQ